MKININFSINGQVTNTILFSPENDYFITSMFCPLDIKPDISNSAKKYKEIKELSDFGEELESKGSNVFFNIKEIYLVSNILGHREPDEIIFKLATEKQKLFEFEFDNFNLN